MFCTNDTVNRTKQLWTLFFGYFSATLAAGALGLVTASRSSAQSISTGAAPGTDDPSPNPDEEGTAKPQSPKYESVVLRGKVVELGPYVLQAFHVPMDDELGKAVVALVTDSGELHPLVQDVRSRGFWMDKRLRDRPMELHVHKFPGLPFVRVIDTYSLKGNTKYAVDYWCTVCAITTFQPGPCPCCQDEIELRERPVDQVKPGR